MNGNKYKILVVEDDTHIRNLLVTMLESADYHVITAETCALAVTLTASYTPDLILLDLGLPDADGMVFLSTLRKSSPTPVIVLSARTNETDKVSALDVGANDYVTKPFSTAELLARVRSALRSRKFWRPAAVRRSPWRRRCSRPRRPTSAAWIFPGMP